MERPDTSSFDAALAADHLAGLWTAKVPSNKGEPPFLWGWAAVHAGLMRAKDEIGIELAERRVVKLLNPHLQLPASSRSVQMNFQLVNPGEVAPAHRHTLAAIRFVIDGPGLGSGGAYTNVEGERCDMAPGDFILTPAWTWHDHFNGAQRPIVWLDGLDGPFIQALNLALFEGYGDKAQPIRNTGGQYRVPWATAHQCLQAIGKSDEHPADAALYRYPDLPTLGCELMRLGTGTATALHRRTSVAMIHVVQGQGRTVFDTGEPLEWNKGDTLSIPAWRWHRHEACSGADAILFRMTDRPLLQALKLYREEIR
jgi:gentisate 1,2-dioxygenase